MIVDDVASLRLQLKLILERQSEFSVVGEAENGEEALTLSSRLQPDVILMDVSMPVMDGIEAARRILEKFPQVKVVMLTASDSDQDVFAALTAGACGYCLKDGQPERIVSAIRGVRGGDLWLDAGIAAKIIAVYEPAAKPVAVPPPSNGHSQKTDDLAEPLSERELEVLHLVVTGCSNRQIAEKLVVSAETVKTHMRHIMEKLSATDRTHAAVKAVRKGLI